MDFEYFFFCTKDKNELLDILCLICDTISAKYNDSHFYSFKSKQQCLYNELVQLSIEENNNDVDFINAQYCSNYNICLNIHSFHKYFDDSIVFMFKILSALNTQLKLKQCILFSESGKEILKIVNGDIKCYVYDDYKYPFEIIVNNI